MELKKLNIVILSVIMMISFVLFNGVDSYASDSDHTVTDEYFIYDENTGSILQSETLLPNDTSMIAETISEDIFDNTEALTSGDEQGFEWNGNTIIKYSGEDINIVIPAKATVIGDNVFRNNTNIVSVRFAEGSNLASIGGGAFSGCTNLESIEFPETITTIGAYSFENCKKISKIVIPESLTSLGFYAFYGCENLTELTICSDNITCEKTPSGAWPEPVYYGRYFGGTNISKLTFADNITAIPDYMFCDASFEEGTEITLPSSVKKMGQYAFCRANGLKAVKYSGTQLKEIGYKSFWGSTSLQTVDLPSSLIAIGDSAFAGCTSFKDFSFPDGFEKIGAYAFSDCKSLTKVTLGESINSLGFYAFHGCENLTELTICSDNITCERAPSGAWADPTYNGRYFEGANISKLTLADNITAIPDYMFCDASFEEGTEITLPSSVKKMGQYAFCRAKGLKAVKYSGTLLKEIGYRAFWCSTSLQTVDLPSSLIAIGDSAFAGCTSLKDFSFPDGFEKIGAYAFSDCKSLTKVKLVESINSLGFYAFHGCENLTELTICSDNITCERAPSGAWADPTYNGRYFEGANISKLTFTDNITAIPDYMFCDAGFESGTEVIIPEKVTIIGQYAFCRANGLSKVIFVGNKLNKICYRAFWNNSTISGIAIPSSVTEIEKQAFCGCTNLLKVTIPGQDIIFGQEVFTGDTKAKFYLVSGSSAYTYLVENGFADQIISAHSIVYVLDGGINNVDNPEAFTDKEVVTFKNPSKKGYSFGGWFEEGTFKNEITSTSGKTDALTIYAKWIPYTYSVKYEANFPADTTAKATSTAVADITGLSSSQTITIPACTYECMKYGFTTWNTKADGTGTSYNPGAKVSAMSEEDGAMVTLYAQWIPAPVSGITLSDTRIAIQVDESAEITAAIEPDDAVNKKLSWSSSDASIATVTVDPADNTKVVIKGLTDGTAQILAVATDGSGCEASCKIVVGKGSVGSTALDTQPAFTTDSIILVKGQKFTLDGEWESSNTSLLAMNKKGAGTAKNKTSASIELKQKENGAVVKTYNVTIVQPGLQKSATLIAGETTQLTVTSAGGLNVTWSSSAPDVASVSSEGVVSGISKGSATVTAYINGVAFNCKVTVKDADTSKRDLTKNVTVKLVPMQTITAKASGFNAKKATWSSDRTPKTEGLANGVAYEDDIVRITKAGKITAIGVGTTALKATGGGKELNFTIEVQEPATQIIHLNEGASKTIKLYGTKGNLSWTASDTSVVKITGNKIQGLKYGETTLTTKYENIDYTVEVYVEDPVITAEGLTGNYPTYTLAIKKGQTVILGIDQVYQDVIFKSNKNNIAFMNEDGVISARNTGKAVMTTKINGKKVTLNVNVSE